VSVFKTTGITRTLILFDYKSTEILKGLSIKPNMHPSL